MNLSVDQFLHHLNLTIYVKSNLASILFTSKL